MAYLVDFAESPLSEFTDVRHILPTPDGPMSYDRIHFAGQFDRAAAGKGNERRLETLSDTFSY